MAEEARHHHYIPQGYLRGFAYKRGERQWYVHVTDLRQRREYPTNTRNVCGQRDFMRIDIPGHAPDRVEKELAAFEAKCVESIRKIAKDQKFFGEDANLAMNLMALLAVRSPEMRENMRGFHERIAKKVMDLSLATKERWEGQLRQMRDAGNKVSEGVTYEQMKAFHEGGKYKVTVRREFLMGSEFQMMSSVLESLGERLWTLYTTDEKRGEFVTTNRPVTLSFINPSEVPAWKRHSPGFALRGTEIHFPLTRHAMLVGRWDRGGLWHRGGHVEEAQDTFVAAANSHMAENSFGQLFSRGKRITYIDQLLTFRNDDHLIKRFSTAPTQEELSEFRARMELYERARR